MSDGEIEVWDHVHRPNSDSCTNFEASLSSDSFVDDLLRNSESCSHTHTCNPPGPDSAHTHTCYHTHIHVIPDNEKSPISKPRRRPLGNREAVRKYREKKKAHTAYLEEEARKLRVMNQVLMRKLQRQGVLETEILRLRSLLVGIRGQIGDELGDFPLQDHCNSIPSDIIGRCTTWETKCQPPTVPCEANNNYLEMLKEGK